MKIKTSYISLYIIYCIPYNLSFLQVKEITSSQPNSRHNTGYIAKSYTYYNSDSYFSKLSTDKKIITCNPLGLWITFTFLNMLIPIVSITRGKVIIFQTLNKVTKLSKSRLYKATVATVILFNIVYTVFTIGFIIKGYPSVLECYLNKHSCRIPRTASNYNYVLGVLITKAVVLPVALIIEFVAAIYITRETMTKDNIKGPFIHKRLKRLIVQVFSIWQLLVFAQITVGLISIPIIVLAFISPVLVLLTSAAILLIFILLIYILTNIPLPNKCTPKFQLRVCLQSLFVTTEVLVIAFLAFSIYITYYVIIKNGMNMSGTKGFIISLIPTIPIPIFIWIIKERFFKQNLKRKGKRNKVGKRHLEETLLNRSSSLSTEEEMIHILSTSEESDV